MHIPDSLLCIKMDLEERFAQITILMQQLTQEFANLTTPQNERANTDPHTPQPRTHEDRNLIIYRLYFDGHSTNPGDYLDREASKEKVCATNI